ncbi:FAD-binding oxidoreductase [Pseudohalioglobus sediminis]|uniref:FAD-binding oxidoreductase n=1 Tax=Pseudohalioglobus sediminis TaxID=2606449 RepID=A0A5B0WR08_9GAMM|nr:FAD-binding oxidoreductase [Pseudohalioglobus sediminis]KAA1189452.1 FAD-binding oxidoreductase [Pseudohalioglobus sediminis]
MDITNAISEIVGPKGMLLGDDVNSRPNYSWGLGNCPARAIVRPASTDELSRVMALCNGQQQTIVPWGGLTGLVNGITCTEDDIAISLERMNAIEHIDAEAGTMTVQAGAVLQNVQDAAAEAGWQFAVDFGARGSANIGGMVATNAGGNSVVRYGMMREQVLGLEAVLADGTVISSMNEMLKNNAGYDLKHLFIGSEGTLGIVTRAVLRLRPAPRTVQTAFVALSCFEDVSGLLRRLGTELEGKLSAFEVMWRNHYAFMTEETGKHQAFLPTNYPFYVLVESEGADEEREAEQFMTVLGTLMEEGHVADAVICQSAQQAAQIWAMRDDVDTLIHAVFPPAVFDISLPIREMEAYVSGVEEELGERFPEAKLVCFGHLGDGNIHFGIGPAHDKHAIETVVYERLGKVNGSISAEHGIGLEKREFLPHSRSADEIALMQTMKRALDPQNLLNPGKVLGG